MEISAIRGAYSNGDLADVTNAASNDILADAFPKSNADKTMLRTVMHTEKLNDLVNEWILPH